MTAKEEREVKITEKEATAMIEKCRKSYEKTIFDHENGPSKSSSSSSSSSSWWKHYTYI